MKFTLNLNGETIGEDPIANGNYKIGRSNNQNMIAIRGPGFGENGRVISQPNNTVSREHLEMEVSDERLILRDLGSLNGSYLDGIKFEEREVNEVGKYLLTIGHNFSLELIASK